MFESSADVVWDAVQVKEKKWLSLIPLMDVAICFF